MDETIDNVITLEWIKPSKLKENWSIIKPGLEKLVTLSDSWIVEDMYLSLLNGSCTIHIGKINNKYIGFVITQQLEANSVITLHVWAAYSSGNDFNMLYEVNDQITEWAKAIEAQKITFFSPRKGWIKQAAKLGFEASPMITYEKRVNYE